MDNMDFDVALNTNALNENTLNANNANTLNENALNADTFNLLNSVSLVDMDRITFLLHSQYAIYGIVMALFCCVVLLFSVFSKRRIFSLRLLFAWILSAFLTLFYVTNISNDAVELKEINIASQIILTFGSSVILLVSYIISLIGNKPKRRNRNFGKHKYWISILSFVVLLAFCCFFNILLFVATSLFYL